MFLFLSLHTLNDNVEFSLNFLTYPVICRRLMHNGLIISLSLYPVKYLNELFVLYGSFLETNILLTLNSYIFFLFLFL